MLALASAATLFAVWQVNERDKRHSGGDTAGVRDSSLRADAARSRAGTGADAENWLDLLRRVPIAAQTAGELFSSSTWAPPPTPSAPTAKPADTPPPFPFVYLGKSVLGGTTSVFLTKATAANAPPGPVFVVSNGETLDGTYRIDSLTDDGLSVTYLPMNKPQTLTFASLVAAAQPQAPGTPVSAGPSAVPVSQAFVPQPLAAAAAASTSTPVAGMAFGAPSIAAAALPVAAAPSVASATGSTPAGSSAINPGAVPAGTLGGQPVGTGILGVPVNNNSPIGFNGAIAPGSMPTGSGAPSGPGPVAK